MKKYKYIGETDILTTNGKIYNIRPNLKFIDDTGTLCGLVDGWQKYFEEVKEIKSCSIVESVRQQLLDRSNAGLLKYGVTLDRDDLSLLDWLEHAKQEQMDSVLYLEKIIQELRKNEN